MKSRPRPPRSLPPLHPDRRVVLGAGLGLAAGAGLGACAGPSRAEGSDEVRDELDVRLDDLTDQSGRYEPIRPGERARRRERLGALLAQEGLGALLVEPGSTMGYLTGVGWGRSERLFALVVLADGTWFWLSPAFEAPRAAERIAAVGVPEAPIVRWDEDEYAFAPLAEALREREVASVAVEPEVRYFVAQRLGEAFGAEAVVPGAAVVRRLRGVKDAHELELLRAANELTQRAIGAVADVLRPGITDRRLGVLMRRAQERLGLRDVWVLPLIGENAAHPHGGAVGRQLARGDLVLVDTGGSLHGYQSDETRTWVFDGAPSEELQRGWNVVRDAQRAAFEAIRPGVACREIDRVARTVVERAGYGRGYRAFAHRLGHGIGMDGHEEPYLDGGSEVLLEPGMTFSDEPGIYVPGRFGIRLEDIVVVTEAGADHFGTWQPSLAHPLGRS